MKIQTVIIAAFAILSMLAARPVLAEDGHTAVFPFGHPGEARNANRVIAVKADDIFFNPKSITVKAGETVKFIVTNTGQLPHEFVLGDRAEQAQHEKQMQAMRNMPMQGKDGISMPGMDNDPNGIFIAPGETKTLVWTFTRPGTVEYACHEPGHYAAGMVGRITIQRERRK
ncbi:MAG TPA: cupredoxin family protein [Gammaproteobacteria bacterium]|nr:cupredoxin family protein [Gammaproteobacteria bacterium]